MAVLGVDVRIELEVHDSVRPRGAPERRFFAGGDRNQHVVDLQVHSPGRVPNDEFFKFWGDLDRCFQDAGCVAERGHREDGS